MTSQEYIESGMLDLYAAGALTPPEQEEVDKMAVRYPEVKVALDEVQTALENYALLHAKAPRPELKEAILSRIPASETSREEPEHGSATRTIPFSPEATAYPDEENEYAPEPKVRSITGREESSDFRSSYRMGLVASVALLVLSMLANFYLYSNWKQTENQLVAANSREQQYAQTYQAVERVLNERNRELAVLRDPQFQPVPLQGQPFAPSTSATVYWNPQSREVYVSVGNLPAPPSGFQYQLWALDDGQPVDAGVFTLDQPGAQLQSMKPIGRAQAFAVTLEPEGGSENPTLDKMVMMGALES